MNIATNSTNWTTIRTFVGFNEFGNTSSDIVDALYLVTITPELNESVFGLIQINQHARDVDEVLLHACTCMPENLRKNQTGKVFP